MCAVLCVCVVLLCVLVCCAVVCTSERLFVLSVCAALSVAGVLLRVRVL